MISEELRVQLQDPAISLRLYGNVMEQEAGQKGLYDPHRITEDLQATVVGYVSDPPRDDAGYTRWLNVLKYRQGGASTTAALAFYTKVAYNDGTDCVVIADKKDRADELFKRVMFAHQNWPEELKAEQIVANEVRQFRTTGGSQMRVLSGHAEAVGIGQSVDLFLGSELPYWKDAPGQFSLIYPSMINRKNALMILESTPAPLDEGGSTQWWMDQCAEAAAGKGRNLYAFFPFWDGKLNRRPWPKSRAPENEEIRLLERYGHLGLTLENLSFRRLMLDQDVEIKKNHDLFGVYYPFDDLTCWVTSGVGVIPYRVVEKHTVNVVPEATDGYTEFQKPDPDAIYIIGVDPAGYGVRDHAAFQVLELWDDAWIQAASFGGLTDPESFVDLLIQVATKYNNARIFVERNGVGAATIALLLSKGYKHVYYDAAFKPGMHKSNENDWLSKLVDALMEKLKLYGKDTVRQVVGYRSDRLTERTPKSEVLAGGTPAPGRRGRHHWDKVSALMVAVVGARVSPTRVRRKEIPQNVVLYKDMTWNEILAYEARCEALRNNDRSRRPRYVRHRRR